ncbi:MAG: hypothetical protein LBL39_05935, partial [Planctomycetaceae bacterium]|nr:hypothetical protein [Planctomycetaceae bacterium]
PTPKRNHNKNLRTRNINKRISNNSFYHELFINHREHRGHREEEEKRMRKAQKGGIGGNFLKDIFFKNFCQFRLSVSSAFFSLIPLPLCELCVLCGKNILEVSK